MIWLMLAGAFVLPIVAVCVGLLNFRGERLSWQTFKNRRKAIDLVLAILFAFSALGQFVLHQDAVTAAIFLAAGLPLYLFGRKIGYMQAFFNDKHNWTRTDFGK